MSAGQSGRALGDEDYERLLAFRIELRDFLRWSEQTAHDAGLTPSLHQLLLVVRGQPPPYEPTVGQAARELHVRHHSAVELAQRAETAELLERARSPVDHRQVHLRLTDHGREQLELLTREHLSRIRTLAGTLERLVRTAEPGEAAAGSPSHDLQAPEGR
ncbi:MAG: MarR family winged helix-turn-helix transcriptional regulator [Solirubrobacteraceae bacterium]